VKKETKGIKVSPLSAPSAAAQAMGLADDAQPRGPGAPTKAVKATGYTISIMPADLDLIKRAVYWTGQGLTISGLFARGAVELVRQMEAERGAPFEPIPEGKG
jgi:hypothetical protein